MFLLVEVKAIRGLGQWVEVDVQMWPWARAHPQCTAHLENKQTNKKSRVCACVRACVVCVCSYACQSINNKKNDLQVRIKRSPYLDYAHIHA